ncbi:GFA family protein [Agrobacterium vitis]|uniref:GFA family protein n=1 Tax=Allorhizobium ampelinum TaxID=3025782 RepID=UPI003AB9AC90|nr:GFA family protein [Allorhizobium ampelinum]
MRRITGGCLCGEVRYEFAGEVGLAGYCHCEDCRRTSGSAFGISVRVPGDGFRFTKGVPRSFTKTGDSGLPITRWFCGDCGSPLCTMPPLHAVAVFIKAGSLDDPTIVIANRQAWVRSRVPWAEIPLDLTAYDTNRTNF